MKTLQSRNVPNSLVVKILKEIQEKGFELDQLAIRVSEYANKFNKCSRGEELVEELTSMGIKEITAVLIANIVPKTPDEVKALSNFEPELPDEETINKILEKVSEYCS